METNMVKVFFRKHWPVLLGVVVGAVAGYLYWRYVGCTTGSCPITSSPVNSTLWGAVMGGLLGNILQPQSRMENNQ
jgi:uncharacterized protein YcfJ